MKVPDHQGETFTGEEQKRHLDWDPCNGFQGYDTSAKDSCSTIETVCGKTEKKKPIPD